MEENPLWSREIQTAIHPAYGKNYRNKSMENYVPGSLVVCSTLIPCEEFLQQSKELKKFASVRKKGKSAGSLE